MTEMINESDELFDNCDACKLLKKDSVAISYCTECEENLCEICTESHVSRRATKTHKPISLQEKENLLKKTCSPCGEKNTEAKNFCEECEEYLCSACTEEHLKRKATKSHDLVEIAVLPGRMAEANAADRFCHICTISGLRETAEMFCVECQELLCPRCTTLHKNSKATSTHHVVEYAELETVNKDVQKSCEPCILSGTNTLAEKYCEECTEYLCKECGDRHGIQKATSSHSLRNACESLIEVQLCDVCITVNEVNPAVLFCKECEEKLCEKCKQSHKNQKSTKNHTLIPLNEKPTSDKSEHGSEECDLCQKADISKPATHFCEVCELFFCDCCTNKHSRQRVTKDHILRDAVTVKLSHTHFCGPCQTVNEEAIAKMHCLDCSENLCDECTTLHKVQKLSKGHTIVNVTEVLKHDTEHCEPCKEENKISCAIKYCTICEEYLCNDCCMFHSRYRQTKDHQLKDIEEFKMENKCNCDPCMFSDKKEVEAQTFCKECKEFFCSSCTSWHRAAKLSRNHVFLSVAEGREQTQNNSFFCNPCTYLDKSTKAFAFCEECKELLCDLCIKHHSSQKISRGHKISTDLSNYNFKDVVDVPESRDNNDKEIERTQTNTEEDKKTKMMKDIPGKPTSTNINADSITLAWEKPSKFEDKKDYYQVSYKEADIEKWNFFPGEHERARTTVTDLKADTKYVFRVRVVRTHGEGNYSEESEVIKTVVSPAAKLIDFSTIVMRGKPSPSIYALPIMEVQSGRNIQNKTKKFVVGGHRPDIHKEKTIMLVGETGTGKSTLVDGIVNYALGVNWSDHFRFTIIDLEVEEKARENNQALSLTEWITVYIINPEPGGRLDYRLNIIDTPGFGDSRGLKRDQEIVEQIRALFSEPGAKGVQYIDAICFLVKAPNERLTAVQSYFFQSIMALCAKDLEQNICYLMTFADGIDPPVLAALNASNLPFGQYFTFNNSCLFAKNVNINTAGLSPMFWDMGLKSFKAFFDHVDKMKTKSLTLTKSVLEERKRLETIVQNLLPQVDAGLAKLNMLNEEIHIIRQQKLDAESNKDFEYEVEEIEQHRHELPKGNHTTNCLHCNYTCHKNCIYPNDDQKKNCSAMDGDGNCNQCPDKCRWDKHSNMPYIFEYVTVKTKKTYQEKLKKYQAAEGKILTHEQVVEKISEELTELQEGIEFLMMTVKDCNQRLSEIALRPNPLSMEDHIELMIRAEQMEQKAGYMKRIAMLEEMKQGALITTKAENLQQQFKQHSKTLSRSVTVKAEKPESKPFSVKKFLGHYFN